MKRKKRKDSGHRAENRWIRIMNDQAFWPDWFLGVRKATLHEDYQEKTDAVVITTYGEIRVQIKSGRRLHQVRLRRELEPLNIVLVIAQKTTNEGFIRSESLKSLQKKVNDLKGAKVPSQFGTPLAKILEALE